MEVIQSNRNIGIKIMITKDSRAEGKDLPLPKKNKV